MNRYFLVDYERIHNRNTCLNGIENLTEQDTVYILFSGEDTGVSFSVMEKISASKAKIVRKHIEQETEDTVPYVIGFYIGRIAGKERNGNYAIGVISDETFGFLTKLSKVNLYVNMTIGKAAAVMPVPEHSSSEWENKFSEIMDTLDLGDGIEKELHKTLKKARETADSVARAAYTQAKVNDLFKGKGFPQDLADSVYNALKPLLDPDNDKDKK